MFCETANIFGDIEIFLTASQIIYFSKHRNVEQFQQRGFPNLVSPVPEHLRGDGDQLQGEGLHPGRAGGRRL